MGEVGDEAVEGGDREETELWPKETIRIDDGREGEGEGGGEEAEEERDIDVGGGGKADRGLKNDGFSSPSRRIVPLFQSSLTKAISVEKGQKSP